MINSNLLKKIINHNNFFGIIIISIFSLAVNQYYGNLGVFPHDSFSHFETGAMIIDGFHPFKDYWVVSGPAIDYFQALIYFIFGISWKSYVLHASIINIFISVFTFIVLRSFELNFKTSLFYSLCFSILAYPSSGTPFVDHHSAFFSLMGVYVILLSIKKDSKFISYLIPLFFILAFLSKQVPSSYLIISIIPIYFVYIFKSKKTHLIPPLFYGSITYIFLILLFGKLNGISLNSFFEQYIFYPQSIASGRFENISLSILGVVGNFKFVLVSLLFLIYAGIKKVEKNHILLNKKTYLITIILVTTIVLIFHQLITRNQIFIFFLIPLIIGVANSILNNNTFRYLLILLCLFGTIKYHERFNEERKFHELENVDLNKALSATLIDRKLNGLRWISPQFRENPTKEISLINEIKNYLKEDKRNKMVQGNYAFLSVILKQNLSSTTRWHVLDGTDYPLPESTYFKSYKLLVNTIIKKNNIKAIYSISPVKPENIYALIDKKCLDELKVNQYFYRFDLKTC